MSGKVLVVDDQKSILLYIQAILSSEGYNVTCASSGEEALELYKKENYDLVISDAIMPPGMNGYDLIQNIKAYKETAIVVLLTGKREKEDVLKGIEAGADDYVVKPVDPQLLLMKVQKLVPKNNKPVQMVSSILTEQVQAKGLLEIRRVSEMGLDLYSEVSLNPGKKLILNSPTFEDLGLNDIAVRVDEVESKGAGFYIKATFVGLSEKQMAPLRVWIRNQNLKAA